MSAITVGGGEVASTLVFVGLGANLGDAYATLMEVLDALRASVALATTFRVSSLYRSSPVEAEGPDFLNAVACFETVQQPYPLLAALQALEQKYGRARPYRHAPRTLDLDLLLYGVSDHGDGWCCTDERLTLPHPRAHLRAFVLAPLAELWPDARIPGHGRADTLLAQIRASGNQRIERLRTH